MPTDHEWSCAVGNGKDEDAAVAPVAKGGKITRYPWGAEFPPPKGAGNYFGEETKRNPVSGQTPIPGYEDRFDRTAPAGSFAANALGLHDLSGNVWEWCQDWNDPGNPTHRVLRGGSWSFYGSKALASSNRIAIPPSIRFDFLGFRIVLEIGTGR